MNPKKWLVVDFVCALSAGLTYILLFDFLQHSLGLPYGMVLLQTVANNAYGVAGLLLFLAGEKGIGLFRFLVVMNFVYAFLCLGFAIYLIGTEFPIGTGVIVGEVFFIFALATLERRNLRECANRP